MFVVGEYHNLFMLYIVGDVELIINSGSSVCGDCIEFTCTVTESNTAAIVRNGTLCQKFERSGSIADNVCTQLNIELRSALVDPNNAFLTTFTVDGKVCFQHKMEEMEIKCEDALKISKSLQLTVDSKTWQ